MKRLFILMAASAAVFCSCSQKGPDPVEVEGGRVSGYVEDGIRIYKGIPFAAPPVGELRWKAPQDVIPWEGVLEATQFAPAPVQPGVEDSSEDCLYLNVWTPARDPDEKLPVLVWIYGGGFAMGATSYYDCKALAQQGVVMVSIAYRVGRLGFFAHPELSAESESGTSGNYGLLDQIKGLEWVRDNISAFGGDPDKVTIFGESAGGISVSMLCASPLAKGLFRGAVSQSGGSFGPVRKISYPGENMKTLGMSEREGVLFAESLGAASVADLREMDASAFNRPAAMTGSAWPIVDGYVIPGDQYALYEEGAYNDVAVLIGYNSDEGLSFNGTDDPAMHRKNVRERYGKYADRLLEAYPVGSGTVGWKGRNLARDAAFGWHTWAWACLQAETGKSPVYLYFFDQHEGTEAGSPHGQDVAFVFMDMPDSTSSPGDRALSETMGRYWTNFAKYLDPNGEGKDSEGLPYWPLFTSGEHVSMILTGSGPHSAAVPDEDALEVLDSYFEWRREATGAE